MSTSTPEPGPASPRPHLSLRWKLTLWVIAIATLIQGTLVVVLLLFQRDAAIRSFDYELSLRTQTMLNDLSESGPPWSDTQLASIALDASGYIFFESFALAVIDREGQVLAVTGVGSESLVDYFYADANGLASDAATPRTIDLADDVGQVRGACLPFEAGDGEPYQLYVATPLTFVDETLRTVRAVLIFTIPIGMLAAGVGGWYLAGIAVAPITKVRRFAEELTPESIRQQIDLQSEHIELRALQDELNQARQRINEGYEAQERFIQNVSHELKTPIAVLLTEAQVLAAQQEISGDARSFVHSVEQEMRRLGAMTESFLLLTQIRSGKRAPRKQHTPLNDLVIDAVQSCRAMADQSAVTLKVSLHEGDGGAMIALGDAALLLTMIDNLIRNAIRFSPCGEDVEIAVRPNHDEPFGAIHVRDYGPGVPADLVDTLFDRFVQAEKETRRRRGTGLGLEIAQGVAKLHGGRITVRNCDDRGCEFTAHIAVTRDESAA